MVDATVSFDENGPTTTPQRVLAANSATVSVVAATSDALPAYAEFCQSALFAPAQSPGWVRNWVTHVEPDCILATLSADGRAVLSLALEVTRSGPFRVARFMGGRHANGNFPAADPAWLGKATVPAIRSLLTAIAESRRDIDLIALERLLPDLDGTPNPLVLLPHATSPNLSLSASLEGGFDALLGRLSGKRKRKKHRAQTRKFEAAGGLRRIEARTPAAASELLDAFFTMKESRFRKMGIANVFGAPQVRGFFHALFAGALAEDKPPFMLHGLEVAGKFRAVTGSSRCGRRLICEFGAIADDELGHASPGDFLFFENIEEACEDGFEVYDFSVGDEPYKRLWCDTETRQAEVLVPLTLKGRALALALDRSARLKAFVKNSPALWKLAKILRRRTARQAEMPADSDS